MHWLFLTASLSNFLFPQNNTELFVDSTYELQWNNSESSEKIYLLHRDNLNNDLLSSYPNGELILNNEVTNNSYTWTIPRTLNLYDLEDHSFRLALTDSNGYLTGSIDNSNKEHQLSDYFSIKTNMNVSEIETTMIPKTFYNITWNGFVYPVNVYLENKVNDRWKQVERIAKNVKNHFFVWEVPELKSNNEYRIKVEENFSYIERTTNHFKIYGIDCDLDTNYNLDIDTSFIDYNVEQYNGNYSLKHYLVTRNNSTLILNNRIFLENLDYNSSFEVLISSPVYNYTTEPIILVLQSSSSSTTTSQSSTSATLTSTTSSTISSTTSSTMSSISNTTSTNTTTISTSSSTNTYQTKTIVIYNKTHIIEDIIPKNRGERKFDSNHLIYIICSLLFVALGFILICIISNNAKNNKISTTQENNQNLNVIRHTNPMYESSSSSSFEQYNFNTNSINRKANNIIYLPQGNQRLCVNDVYG